MSTRAPQAPVFIAGMRTADDDDSFHGDALTGPADTQAVDIIDCTPDTMPPR